jgi:hypothetical protein
MHNSRSQLGISRRGFLQILAAGVTAIGGYALFEFSPWLNLETRAAQIRSPFSKDSIMQELIRYATLAANGHNTQAWAFVVKDHAIEIHPDFSRRLTVVDPLNRELWISLGCALENLLIGARAIGFAPEVNYPEKTDFITVHLSKDIPEHSQWFDAIAKRQNTRSLFDGQAINSTELKRIQKLPLEPGVVLQIMTEPKALETVLEYVNQGNLTQYADQAFVQELIDWLRFNKREASNLQDGLYSKCSGNPEVPRWLGRMFVTATKPQQQADTDAKKLRSSAGAILIASASEDKTSWVRTGQVVERLALELTSLDIKSAFLNQPIEVPVLRNQFQHAMKLENALPQLLLRFGRAQALPFSMRRPLEQVLLQS